MLSGRTILSIVSQFKKALFSILKTVHPSILSGITTSGSFPVYPSITICPSSDVFPPLHSFEYVKPNPISPSCITLSCAITTPGTNTQLTTALITKKNAKIHFFILTSPFLFNKFCHYKTNITFI